MEYVVVLLIVCAIVYAIVHSKNKTNGGSVTSSIKGHVGEARVRFEIEKLGSTKQFVINNLILNVGENKTAQIDHVLINRNGIFVIETKNYSGRIYGNENQLEWTQVLSYGNVKNKIYNPLKQNKTHVYHISNVLTDKLPIVPAVVFVKGNIEFIDARGVYTLKGLKRLINEPHGELTEGQMRKAYTELMNANNTSISTHEHVENIRSMQSDVKNNICPRCGKKLVLRKGKYGDFYGCSGYPSCKFIKKN